MTIRPIYEREVPSVTLAGTDGNARVIVDRVRQAMHKARWTPEETVAAIEEMKSDDYVHLLLVVLDLCAVSG